MKSFWKAITYSIIIGILVYWFSNFLVRDVTGNLPPRLDTIFGIKMRVSELLTGIFMIITFILYFNIFRGVEKRAKWRIHEHKNHIHDWVLYKTFSENINKVAFYCSQADCKANVQITSLGVKPDNIEIYYIDNHKGKRIKQKVRRI